MRRILIKIYGKCSSFFCGIINGFKLSRFELSGEKPKVRGILVTYGHGKLSVDKNVAINSSLRSNPIGALHKTMLFIERGAHLEICENAAFTNCAIACKKHIKIGKNVRIGSNTSLFDSDFHSLDLNKRISKKDDDIKSAPIEIKEGAFVGGLSIVLKGVTIGKNSIVGAGSVVTKDIPDNEIWAGNPARFIRKL